MKRFALILCLILPSFVAAQKFDDKVKLNDIGPIVVELMDGATNGCWTNLMEAKNYAAGQIDIAGGKVVETAQEASSVFVIYVQAQRMDDGLCFGGVLVSIYRPHNHNGVNALALFSQLMSTGVQANFNNLALDVTKQAVQEWIK